MFEKYPKCFYVFVGERTVKKLENISETVQVVSKHFGRTRPTAIVVMGKFTTAKIENMSKFFITYPMVLYLIMG